MTLGGPKVDWRCWIHRETRFRAADSTSAVRSMSELCEFGLSTRVRTRDLPDLRS